MTIQINKIYTGKDYKAKLGNDLYLITKHKNDVDSIWKFTQTKEIAGQVLYEFQDILAPIGNTWAIEKDMFEALPVIRI